jgi:hypothetical protein
LGVTPVVALPKIPGSAVVGIDGHRGVPAAKVWIQADWSVNNFRKFSKHSCDLCS